MSESRATPTGVYGLLRRTHERGMRMNAADVADCVDTGVMRASVILKALVAAGLAHTNSTVPVTYTPVEIPNLAARRKALKFARELWQETRPPGNSEARQEIARFKGGRYSR